MSKVRVQAIEPFNSHRPGDTFELSEREAQQAAEKGLVKLAGRGASRPTVTENKNHPPKAAGVARPSSASRAARPSRATTAKPSGAGDKAEAGAG